MGFNPFRPVHKSPLDIALVAGTIVVIVILLAWAIRG
jgi:hypothetical protein